MNYTTCEICSSSDIALNDTIKIDDKTYCGSCLEQAFPEKANLDGKLVEKNIDPTICSSCHKDFDSLILNKISVYPLCEECESKIKTRTFPGWVKAFFVAVLVVIIVGFIWNFKYYQAYKELKAANQSFINGDFANAHVLMSSASKKVPEVEDLTTLATYFHGIELLSKDKSEEALEELEKCKEDLSQGYQISTLILQARIGASFDKKDYRGFLEASKERLSLDTSSVSALTSVASAYACVYANENKDDARQIALQYLTKAKAIDDTSREMRQYYNMIEYRIDSKRIIRREEFNKQFPNGWTKNL